MRMNALNLVFVSRPSKLALQQSRSIMQALQNAHPGLTCEERIVLTQGDHILNRPLPEIGGKGLFTQELENELLSCAAQCAVHSLKDLPIESQPQLTIGCIPLRADPRDVLVSARGYRLDSLPSGALVGTSSLRRSAQLLAQRPDIKISSLRGNVDTRLRKAQEGQYDAIVLASAGIIRLGLADQITQWLSMEAMLPAPGQGALAVQCRADDDPTLNLLAELDDGPTHRAVTAERQFLLGLGGGCSAPVAAYAEILPNLPLSIRLTGRVLLPDGTRVVEVSGEGTDPIRLGADLAQQAIQRGAADILAQVSRP